MPPILQVLPTRMKPPTFHRTNKVTEGFQTLIDSYGIATYQEVNPGLFTVITFPFLFAVMFGDIGHGFIVLMSALYMIYNERKLMRAKNGEVCLTLKFIFFANRIRRYSKYSSSMSYIQYSYSRANLEL